MADIPALWLYRSDADGSTVGPVELSALAAAWAAGEIDGLTPVAAAPDAGDPAAPSPDFLPLSSVPLLRAALAAIPVTGEDDEADDLGMTSAEAAVVAGGELLAPGGEALAGEGGDASAPEGPAAAGRWPSPPHDVANDTLVADEPAYDEEVYAPSPPPPLPLYTDVDIQGGTGGTMDAHTAALVGMDASVSAEGAAAAADTGPPAAAAADTPTTASGDAPPSEAAAATEEARLAKARKRARARANRAARAATAHTLYWSGAPPDVTVAEVATFFAVCGVLATGADGSPRVKCYGAGGDGLVTYALEPSVKNALRILDGGELRQGWRLKVEPATRRPKDNQAREGTGTPAVTDAAHSNASGAAGPPVAKRPRVDGGGGAGGGGGGRGSMGGRGAPLRRRGRVPTVVSWADDAEEGVAEGGPKKSERRILILTNVFDAAEAAAAGDTAAVSAWYAALHDEMVAGATAVAPVEKVTVFKRSPVGAVAVKYRSGAGAAAALGVMDGRWFGGRRLTAAWWDGKDYRVAEGADEAARRGKSWAAWLEGQEGAGGGGAARESAAALTDAKARLAGARDPGGGGVENGDAQGVVDVAARASEGGSATCVGTPAEE
ncbi:hypothetical protein MMPV_009815 [Pyropia vietnamensis]